MILTYMYMQACSAMTGYRSKTNMSKTKGVLQNVRYTIIFFSTL